MAAGKISIIVPVYNGAAVIGDCLRSIFASPISAPFEVIVVDDGSTDGTADVVRQFPVILVQIEKSGVAKARNTAIRLAKGDILLFFDADVTLFENTIARFLDHFHRDKDAFIIQGRWAKTYPVQAFANDFLLLRFYFNTCEPLQNSQRFSVGELMTGCCGFRREVLTENLRFNESYKFAGGEEFELGLRLLGKYQIYYYSDIFVYHKFEGLWKTAKKMFLRSTNYAMLIFGSEHREKFSSLTATSVSWRDKRSVLLLMMMLLALPLAILSPKHTLVAFLVLVFAYFWNIRQFLVFLRAEKNIAFAMRGALSEIFITFPRLLGLLRAGIAFYVLRQRDYKI